MSNLTEDYDTLDEQERLRQEELLKYLEQQKRMEAKIPTRGRSAAQDDAAPMRSVSPNPGGASSAANEEFLLGQDKFGVSYLDDYEKQKQQLRNTSYSDQSRWGKSANEVYDETKMNWGSYLDTHEKLQSVNKKTTYSDQTRWGKAGEIFDENKLNFGSYLEQQARQDRERAELEAKKKAEAIAALKEGYLDPEENVFPYAELKGKFPKGVDPTKKEAYLDDEEFRKLFGMSFDQFQALPPFKKGQLKKKLDLYQEEVFLWL